MSVCLVCITQQHLEDQPRFGSSHDFWLPRASGEAWASMYTTHRWFVLPIVPQHFAVVKCKHTVSEKQLCSSYFFPYDLARLPLADSGHDCTPC